jgi:hypothetical protein
MNKKIALEILESEMLRLRTLDYSVLGEMVGTSNVHEVKGEDGKAYQVDTEVRWDNRVGDDIRVFVSVDDGGLSACSPLTRSFLKARDGRFVGER